MSVPAATARTLPFIPGLRGDRFAKAPAAGSDGILLDRARSPLRRAT